MQADRKTESDRLWPDGDAGIIRFGQDAERDRAGDGDKSPDRTGDETPFYSVDPRHCSVQSVFLRFFPLFLCSGLDFSGKKMYSIKSCLRIACGYSSTVEH